MTQLAEIEVRADVAAGTHPLGDVLGNAKLKGVYIDGSPEWLAARMGGIGGSEIASILGWNNFKSRYVLWHQKAGILPPDDGDNPLFEWGHRLEPAVADKFASEHPELRLYEGGSWENKDRPWQNANPDRLLVDEMTGEIGVLEIKTSMRGHGWEKGSIPKKYLAQVRWYLDTFGLKYAYIVCLISLGEYVEHLIGPDWEMTVQMRSAGQEFMNQLAAGSPPAVDAGDDTYESLRVLHPDIDTKAEVEIGRELAVELTTSLQAEKDAIEAAKLAKNRVMEAMGRAKFAMNGGEKVASRTSRMGGKPFLKVA